MDPYHVRRPTPERSCVEVWSSYQLQFGDQRGRQPWQNDFAAELGGALRALALTPDEVLAGDYATTDPRVCDVENRLFTNPGTKVVGQPKAISFERNPEPPPRPPVPLRLIEGHLHYYRYRASASWQWWEADKLLAHWSRVPRRLADDGSARPTWLAMRMAAKEGLVTVHAAPQEAMTGFGVRLLIHASPSGPRSAAAVCEPLVDGVISAFHAGDLRPQVASLVAERVTAKAHWIKHSEVEEVVRTDGPGPLFPTSPLTPSGAFSPADDRCFAGAVAIRRDAGGLTPEISGELFTLRRRK